MKLLLHTCCAPCMIYPLRRLQEMGMETSGFFYNPNIHPLAEYNNRKAAVEQYGKTAGIEVVFPAYEPRDFFHAVNMNERSPQRCLACWSMRLGACAGEAKQRKFDGFTTTLLVSPYQDQEALKKIGEACAQKHGVSFYYEDFRPGFKEAHDTAKKAGIYCQKYCGCLYSEIERYSKPKQK